MSADRRILLRNLGLILHVPGLMALATLPLTLVAGDEAAVAPLVLTMIVSLVPAQLLTWTFRDAGEIRRHHAMTVAALSWILVPLIGAIPFIGMGLADAPGAGLFAYPWNALFEAFSGFTGTGLTVVERASQLPVTLQWWRSFSEWIGGVGVIMVMLSILGPSSGAHRMYFAEAREERILPSIRGTARTMWWIFLGYTVLAILAFRVCGMPWWEAVNHGMTGVSTGGFSVTDGSFADYPLSLRLVAMPVMVIGAISFAMHHRILRGQLTALWRDGQHRYLLLLLAAGAGVAMVEGGFGPNGEQVAWIDSAFQWVSALATAGFQSADLSQWSPALKLMLTAGMLLGGAVGSTVGGLKQARLHVLVRGVVWRMRRLALRPREVQRYEIDGGGISEKEARSRVETTAVFAFVWVVALVAGVLVMLHVAPGDPSLDDVLFEVASAQGNVGLSTGLTGEHLPWPAKLSLIVSMYAGRLEIMPLLLLLLDLRRRLSRRRR